MRSLRIVLSVMIFGVSIACQKQEFDEKSYLAGIEEWHKNRITRLTQADSWLSLEGLFWLETGENRFGSAGDNDLIFPAAMPAHIGRFLFKDSLVTVEIDPRVTVHMGDKPVREASLRPDVSGTPDILKWETYSWYVIKREDRYGIRLKNSASRVLKDFKGIKRFPVDLKWRVRARLVPHESSKALSVPNVLGQIVEEPSPGKLVFTLEGREFSLDPIAAEGDKEYFIIFGDNTNGESTYGAGRFLTAPLVNEQGVTWIDFNRAYNPPCVFTPYATCPLPPSQNKLDIAIAAGEKVWGEH